MCYISFESSPRIFPVLSQCNVLRSQLNQLMKYTVAYHLFVE